MIFKTMPEMKPFLTGFIYFSALLMAGGLFMAIRTPKSLGLASALVLLVIGQLYMGCFEFLREGGRRPYIIRDHMYSNSILKKDLAGVRHKGVLTTAKWTKEKEVRDDNLLASGRELYNLLCLPCHSIGGPLNDILPMTGSYTPWGLANMIQTIDRFHPYMPPFPGTPDEARALATYIATGLHGGTDPGPAPSIEKEDVEVPGFDDKTAQYVLLSWTDMGMQAMTDSSGTWMMLPPGVNLHGLLIKRGESPEIISERIKITYKVDAPFADPASQIDFWANAEKLYGKKIAANTGLTGNGLAGSLEPGENDFSASLIPVVPYTNSGSYMPYPSATVTASDADGTVLATTRVVLPTATEMGCKTCHGGQWRMQGRAGLASATAENILTIHDRLSGTRLAEQAAGGKPVLCQQCHQDDRVGLAGDGKRLNMSASMHGLHANFIADTGQDACVVCHPAGETGATRAFRGLHHSLELGCTDCHGSLADHAISLLKAEEAAGKKRATILMKHLRPQVVASAGEIKPRRPWINEPDCLNCHEEFEAPSDTTTFNSWTADRDELFSRRTDEAGFLPCSACHNAMHALYPAVNPYGDDLDNRQPGQYQHNALPMGSNRGCAVCHTVAMEEEMHHPNMLREFRNQ